MEFETNTVPARAVEVIPARSDAEEINGWHRDAMERSEEAVELARRIGRRLIEIKKKYGHGGFMEWVKNNCCFSHPTAGRYMRAAKSEIDHGDQFSSIAAALRALAPDRERALPALTDGRTRAEADEVDETGEVDEAASRPLVAPSAGGDERAATAAEAPMGLITEAEYGDLWDCVNNCGEPDDKVERAKVALRKLEFVTDRTSRGRAEPAQQQQQQQQPELEPGPDEPPEPAAPRKKTSKKKRPKKSTR